MFVKQISVFLENKPGKLAQVTKILRENQIDLSAISIADTTEFGILRMIVNKPEEALIAIKAAGFPVSTTQVLAVEVADQPGGLDHALQILDKVGIVIEYLYSFIKRNGSKALILFRVDEPQRALEVLQSSGVKLYSAEDICCL